MVTESETANGERQERLADLYQRLAAEGAGITQLLAVANCPRPDNDGEAFADPTESPPDDALGPAFIRHATALQTAASAALMNVALCPCEADEIPAKLRHLLASHKRAHGAGRWRTARAPEIMAALDLHFGDGDKTEAPHGTEGE